MPSELNVEPSTILVGQQATWLILTDVDAPVAWWFGDNDGQPISSPVPGWSNVGQWVATYQYFQPGTYQRWVTFYDENGDPLDSTGLVTFQVIDVGQPPSFPPPQGPPEGPPDGFPPFEGPPIPPDLPTPPSEPPGGGGGGFNFNPPGLNLPGGPDLTGPVGDLVNQLRQFVSDRINDLGTQIGSIAQALKDDIGTQLANMIPTAIEILGANTETLAAFVGAFLNNQVPVGDYWTALGDQLGPRVLDSLGDAYPTLRDVIIPAWAAVAGAATPEHIGPVTDVMHWLGIASPTPSKPDELLDQITNAPGVERLALSLFLGLAALLPTVEAMAAGSVELYRQAAMIDTRPVIPSPDTVVEAQIRGAANDDDLNEVVRRTGLDDRWIPVIRAGARRLIELGDLFDLWRRQAIDDSTFDSSAQQLGFTADDLPQLHVLHDLMPSPTDVLRFMTRDVFFPDVVEAFGMDQEWDIQNHDLLNKVGISDDLGKVYWEAHWDLPSVEQVYQMIFRGGLDPANLDRFLRAKGVEPFWRPYYTAISHRTFTRVDVRRMHKVGVLDEQGVLDAYKRLGYADDDAQKLSDFTVQLNHTEISDAIAPWRSTLRTKAVTAYDNGTIDADELRGVLADLAYTSEQIDAIIAESDLDRTIQLRNEVRGAVQKLYTSELWDKDQATTQLVAEGFGDQEQARLFELWDVQLQYHELSATHHATRELTKAEVIDAYKDALEDAETTRGHLHDLGYGDSEIDTLLALADYQIARATQTAARDAIHAQYVAGRIDRTTASAQLDQLNVPADARDSYLARWDVERDQRVAHIPLSSIEQMVNRDIINEADARSELGNLGYNDDQATLLLALWGNVRAEAEAKAKAAEGRTARRLSETEIKRALLVGLIDLPTATQDLTDLGYVASEIPTILALSQQEIGAQNAIALLKLGAIDVTETVRRLRRLGYSQADAQLLAELGTGVQGGPSGGGGTQAGGGGGA